MLKKILDIIFSKKETLSEKEIEEYLSGKDLSEIEKSRFKSKKFLFVVVSIVIFLALAYQFLIRPRLNETKPQLPNLIAQNQSFKTQAQKKNRPSQTKIRKPSSASTAAKKKISQKPKRPKTFLSQNRQNKTASSSSVAVSKAATEASEIEIETQNELAQIRNPFDVHAVAKTIDDLTIRTKILDKQIELYDKLAKLIEIKKKIEELQSDATAQRENEQIKKLEKEIERLKNEIKNARDQNQNEVESNPEGENQENVISLLDRYLTQQTDRENEDENVIVVDDAESLNQLKKSKDYRTEASNIVSLYAFANSIQFVDLKRKCLIKRDRNKVCYGERIILNDRPFVVKDVNLDEKSIKIDLFDLSNKKDYLVLINPNLS